MSMRSVPHDIGPHSWHEKVRRLKIVLKLQILKKIYINKINVKIQPKLPNVLQLYGTKHKFDAVKSTFPLKGNQRKQSS